MLICASYLEREGQTQFPYVAAMNEAPKFGGAPKTKEIIKSVPWMKIFATGPENLLHNRHMFFFKICRVIVSKSARGTYETKRHYQSPNLLRQNQPYPEKYCRDAVREKDARLLHGGCLAEEQKIFMDWKFLEMDHKQPLC